MQKPPNVVQDVYAELRAHIVKKYRLQKNAAEALGIEPTALSQMLNNKRPIAERLLKDAGIEVTTQKVYTRLERRKGDRK